MTGDPDDDHRRRTLHGEPLPLPDYTGDLDPQKHRRRTGSAMVVAVAAVTVVVVGLGGLLAWAVLRDGSAGTVADTSSSAPRTVTVTRHPMSTEPTQAGPPRTEPTEPDARSTPTGTPGSSPSTGEWYAQFGAFDDYGNAAAEAERHYGAVILPGSDLGVSARYVVVRPAATRADAEAVCSHFADGACYVRSR